LGDAVAGSFPDPAATPVPTYDTGYDELARYNRHPANIRFVRLSAVLRSSAKERTLQRFPPMRVENYDPGATLGDGFYRSLISSTIRIGNMTSRSFFTPPLRETMNGTDDELNAGGS
jgi:type IV pilus assembly protein PilW